MSPLCRALVLFGFPKSAVPTALFLQDGNIVNFGVPPVRVDFINQIDGVSYAKARKSIVRGHYGKIEVSFIGLTELVQNKQATPRPQDKVDVAELSAIQSTAPKQPKTIPAKQVPAKKK